MNNEEKYDIDFFNLFRRSHWMLWAARVAGEPDEILNELSLDAEFYLALWRN